MTQVPNPLRPSAVPVVPEDAPAAPEPSPTTWGRRSTPSATAEARQFVVDMMSANRMPFAELVVRHARALSALRAVWASRRRWQSRAAELEEQRDRDRIKGAVAVLNLECQESAARRRIAELEEQREEREPLGYVVLDGRSATPRLKSIGVSLTREEAEAWIDNRTLMARHWNPGIRDVLCEIHPVRDLEGER